MGVDWRPCHDEGGNAALAGIGSGSDGKRSSVEGRVDGCTGEDGCAGEDVSGSEETTMVGELWPPGMVTVEEMEETNMLFRVCP